MDEYPTEEVLEKIRRWSASDPIGLFNFIEEQWSNYGKINRLESGVIQLVTGGWSGNEDIVSALNDNQTVWSMFWKVSWRGGLHEFHVPESFP